MRSRTLRRWRRVLLAAGIFASAGCAGGGGLPGAFRAPQASERSAASASHTSATVEFTWPARAIERASARRRNFISPAVASLSIVVDSNAPITESEPAPTGSPETVRYTIAVAPGTHALTVAEYDAKNNLLGRGSSSITVVEDEDNLVPLTLDGNLAQIAIVPVASPFLQGSLAAGFTLVGDAAQKFEAIPEDADGNRITSPGTIPAITVTSAKPASVVATDLGSDEFSLFAPVPTGFVTITASGKNLAGDSVTATLKADALAAFYIANFTTQTINVYDENGTQLTMPKAAFASVENPSGITYVPPAKAGNAGTLVITQVADSSTPTVEEYDTAGNLHALGSSAFAGTAEPVFAGYNAASPGTLAVPDENSNVVQLFNLAGVAQSTSSTAFNKLDRPIGVVFDPHDKDYYVTSFGSATIGRYSASGAAIGGQVSAGNATEGAAFDPDNDQIYVLYAGMQPITTIDGKPVTVGAQLAGVLVFNETPAKVTESVTDFLPPSTTAFYEDIVVDPYLKQLYITDAGDNKVVSFTEAGATVNLASGTFGNLSDPMGIALVP